MSAVGSVARVRTRSVETGSVCRCEGGRSHLVATFRLGALTELLRQHDARCPMDTVRLDPRAFAIYGSEVPRP